MKVNDLLAIMSLDSRVFFESEKDDWFTDVYRLKEVPAKYLDMAIKSVYPLLRTICITIAE